MEAKYKKSIEIRIDDIESIKINLAKNDSVKNGQITFHLRNAEKINLFSIQGGNEKYLNDDLEKIVHFLKKKLFNK